MADSPHSPYERYIKWSKYYGDSMNTGVWDINERGTKFSSFIEPRRPRLFSDDNIYKREFNFNTVKKQWEVLGSKPTFNPISLLLRRFLRIFSR